jgi:AcrR family transcriptional regulator
VTAESGGSETDLKARLKVAGLTAFARIGYARTSVDDVIELANTSRATFYRYFDNKQALFRELSGECFRAMQALADRLAERPEEDPTAKVAAFLAGYENVHVRYGGVIRAWTENTWKENHGPDDRRLREEADRAFVRLVDAFVGPIKAARIASPLPPELRAAMLYVVVERSHFYIHSEYSSVDAGRLHRTLSVMVHRAFFGGDAHAVPRLRVGIR